jgi:hypothetical protein
MERNIMATNAAFQALHDKLTGGMPLSLEERTALESWYKQQDEEEAALLNKVPESNLVTTLRTEVQAADAELQTVTRQIQAVTAENASLRREITDLQARVLRRSKAQPA